jgi:protein O-mannosyl-transferase
VAEDGHRGRWRWRSLAGPAALMALLAGLAGLTARRAGVWATQLSLWSDAVEKAPGKARAHLSLGYALRRAERYGEAVAEYQRGLAVVGDDKETRHQLQRNLAAALIWQGRNAQAVTVLEEALRVRPHDSELLGNLAAASLALHDLSRAERAVRRGLEFDPDNESAWNILGATLSEMGRLEESREAFRRALALNPDDGLPARNLARTLDRLGDRPGACSAWRQAQAGRLSPAMSAEVARDTAARGCR